MRGKTAAAGPSAVMDEDDVARKLGVSVRTLQRWRVEGRGPAYRKLGKAVRYTDDDIAEFVAGARRTSTSQSAAA